MNEIKKSKIVKKILVIVTILFFPGIFFIYLGSGKHTSSFPDFFGPYMVQGSDTVYYTVPEIKLEGIGFKDEVISEQINKIKVVEFYVENSRLRSISEAFEGKDDIFFYSINLDTSSRGINRVNDYIKRARVRTDHWGFYKFGDSLSQANAFNAIFPEEESFNLDSLQTKGYNVFVLLDKECHIRGYFDSFTTKRLEGDIRMLKKEEGHTAYYGKE